jgi:hypothetical protein
VATPMAATAFFQPAALAAGVGPHAHWRAIHHHWCVATWSFNMAQLHFRQVLWRTQLHHQNAIILHQRASRKLRARGHSSAKAADSVADVSCKAEEECPRPLTPPPLQQHKSVDKFDPTPTLPTKARDEPPSLLPPPSSLLHLHPPDKSRVSVPPPEDEPATKQGQPLDALLGIEPDDFQLNHKSTFSSIALVMETLHCLQKQGITRAQFRYKESTDQDSTSFYVLRVLTNAQAFAMDHISPQEASNDAVEFTRAMTLLQELFQQHHVIWLQVFLASGGSDGTVYALRGLTDAQAIHIDVEPQDLSDADHEPTGSDDDDASS